MKQLLVTFASSVFLIACSFDNTFLYPNKIGKETKRISYFNHELQDSLIIYIGKDFQPTFYNSKSEIIDFGCTIESILFDSANGNVLNGWLMSPLATYNEVIVLFFHGNAGNITTHFERAIPLVNEGFKVFIFDYSGYGFSEGKATRNNVLLDANSALKYLHNSKKDSERFILYGQSLGGHLAASIAADNQNIIDATIIEGAFSSHKNIAAESAGLFGRLFVAEKYSGLEAIQRYKKPLLIIHSKDDEIIPFAMGKELFDTANQPKSFYPIEHCHICGTFHYADSISKKILELLK